MRPEVLPGCPQAVHRFVHLRKLEPTTDSRERALSTPRTASTGPHGRTATSHAGLAQLDPSPPLPPAHAQHSRTDQTASQRGERERQCLRWQDPRVLTPRRGWGGGLPLRSCCAGSPGCLTRPGPWFPHRQAVRGRFLPLLLPRDPENTGNLGVSGALRRRLLSSRGRRGSGQHRRLRFRAPVDVDLDRSPFGVWVVLVCSHFACAFFWSRRPRGVPSVCPVRMRLRCR